MPRLVVEKGIDKGKSIEVSPRGTIVIGRDASAGLRLGDMMASRLHFRLEHKEDGVWLFDLKSMNGTYVNGERIHEARLKPGDRVQVGETLLTYVSDEDAEELDALVGTVISGYKVLERVGRGGMGTVYKAEQLSLKRIVAVKVISNEHTKDKTFVDLFLREARAAAQLNHPNIVQVYDAKGAEGTYFYSMEFVPHGSVQDLLSAEKKLPPERAAKMTLQAARGLEYAERKEIVHRDIKPDNLMIGELEGIKIADLGLAQSAKEASKIEETRTVLGTPHYIAPEQVLGRPADHRSDIYSLGATLYRMLAGTTPYTGQNVMEIVQRKVREDPMPLNDLDPGVPKRMSELVQKMMARKPEERFQKVTEVVEALELCLNAPPATTITAGPRRGARPPAWLWAGAGAAAAVLLVVALALTLGGGGTSPKPDPSPTGTGTVPPPVVVNPGTPDAEEELAQVYFQQALDFEAKQLKKDKESSIEEAIARYQKILDKCARSSKVDEAQTRIAALRGLLGRASALSDLRAADRADADAFARLLAQSKDALPDPALLRAVVAESTARYAKIEQAHSRTEAGQQARQFRSHIASWLTRCEAAAARFAETDTAARQESAAGRFGPAIDRWKAFRADQQETALKSPFSDGRYGPLLADDVAETRIRELQADAVNAFQEVRQEANTFVAASRFDDAKACYQKAIETSGLPDIADRARAEIGAIDRKIIEKLDAERKQAEELERQRLQQDVARLAQAAAAVQPLVRQYDFLKAVEAHKKETAALTTDKHKAAAAARLLDLESLARLKDGLIRRANATEQTRDFVRFIRTKTQSGEISGASEERILIQVTIGGSGGMAELPAKWTEFSPKEYCALFRGRWGMTASDLLDLARTYREFGFSEEADDLARQAQAKATDAATRDAAARLLESLGPAGGAMENREAEADRRLTRARALAEQRRYADAKLEIEAILKSFADTDTVKKARTEVDALLKEVTDKVKGEDDKAKRTQRTQRYRDVVAQELREAKTRRNEVAARLPLISDEIEKRYQTLLVAMAWQDWVQATTIGENLRAALETQLAALAAGGDLSLAAAVYSELLRLDTINGDKARFDRHAKEASNALATYTPWANRTAPLLASWHDKTFPESVVDVKKLVQDIEADPAPDLLWKLAKLLRHDVPLRRDERQALRALMELQPDYKEVASGEILFRLAENAIAFREIPYALTLIEKLKTDYPDSPRLKPNPTTELSPIDYLVRDCNRLGQLLGYVKKSQ